MFVKATVNCPPRIANDGCEIREVLHPTHDPVQLPYSLAVATIGCGERTYRHRLQRDEVYYLLEGEGLMRLGIETQSVSAGDAVVIPRGAIQWIENTGNRPLRFIALVSPPWLAADDERLE